MTLQSNTEPFHGDDLRTYEVGRLLRFVGHDPAESAFCAFSPGDLVRTLPTNACGMGIDVRRESDGLCDMVWASEVEVVE